MTGRISMIGDSRQRSRTRRLALAKSFAVPAFAALTVAAHAQTYTGRTLFAFSGVNGNSPSQGVTRDSSGNLYGTTAFGGTSGNGIVFKLTNTGTVAAPVYGTPTTVAELNGTNGSEPSAQITFDAAGNLYTTTVRGGNTAYNAGFGDGTIIQITPGGVVNTLATQTDSTGSRSYSGVVFDSNRNIFVACGAGGNLSLNNGRGYGDVIELVNSGTVATPVYSGAPVTLATLSGTNGDAPEGQLILDSHGNIFGTTYDGGDLTQNSGRGAGTVFEMRNTGTVAAPNYGTGFTTLGLFENSNGNGSAFGLVEDSLGNLYGGTELGGDLTQYSGNGAGTIYKIANTGTLASPTYTGGITTLCNLETTNGLGINGSMLLDSKGDLLGVTGSGGDLTQANGYGGGAVIELANTGTVANPIFSNTATTLYGFQTATGYAPIGNLALDPSGNLFGGLSEGGANNDGAIFELSPGSTSAPEPGAIALFLVGIGLGIVWTVRSAAFGVLKMRTIRS